MQILSFLVGQAGKVLRWFAPDFYENLQKLQGFFGYIWGEVQNQIRPVYSSFLQGLQDVYYRATNFVDGIVNAVRNYANDLHGIATNEINLLGLRFERNLRNGMNIVQAALTALQETLQAIINSVIGRTQTLIWQVRDSVVAFVSQMLPRLNALVQAALLPVYDFINRHVSAFNSQIQKTNATIRAISIVIDMFSDQVRKKIVAFTSDPLGYILALLLPVLLDIIFQKLAEGLGAVGDTVPMRKAHTIDEIKEDRGFMSTRVAAIAEELANRSEFSRDLGGSAQVVTAQTAEFSRSLESELTRIKNISQQQEFSREF